MKAQFDAEADAASLQLSESGVFSHNVTLELSEGLVILDVSVSGTVLAIEFVGVSRLLETDTIAQFERDTEG
ncbi:hypothetical protein JD292_08735 [Leucobacter sp. CSA2]|uniref:DUF2283 domain-containing protein n=1 Tax=Leucobacter edaphi TaxID=2796472 RepID=A0A934QCL1_9MICO|nr:hypothetical protein [Leucobacter edaphi]MBK0422160.1 hypothetical protein [Leucobacter edaphi]